MKDKGFTLVELLGVIVLLGILGIVIIPKVGDSITNSKEQSYKVQEESIKKAVNDFLVDNTDYIEENDTITIKLGVLKQKGYLPVNIKNPKTRKNISNESLITITRVGDSYTIKLALVDLQDVTEDLNNNSPILVLNGDYIEYVEVNDLYQEKGAIAKTSTGETISTISKQIKLNNVEKSTIDTSQLLTYNVIYSATDSNGLTTSATRTVIVRDTKAPTITYPIETTLHVSEVADFNIMQGVSVTDNYTQTPLVTSNSSLAALPGKYVITYTVKDSSNNQTIEKRVIKVEDTFDKYYAQAEYIESTGTQYIDTGVIPNQNTKVEIDFQTNGISKWILGSRTTPENPNSFALYYVNNNQYWIRIGDGEGDQIINANSPSRRTKISITSSNFINDGTTLANYSANNETGSYSLYIGALNQQGTAENRIFIGKIYASKIWNGETLIRNFIPALRKSDNTAGLYDTINNKFYMSATTESYEYKIKNENPYERLYTKLDYIESTGTQYINTYYVPNVNTKVEMDYYSNAVGKWFFGSRTIVNNSDSFAMFLNSSTEYWPRVGNGEGDTKVSVTSTTGRHKINVSGSKLIQDNTPLVSYTANNTLGSCSIFIGALHQPGSVDDRIFTGKIYSFKIWDNDELVRNFIPAKRNSDNVIGLYDEVNDIFYTNSGTGEFTPGNPIN